MRFKQSIVLLFSNHCLNHVSSNLVFISSTCQTNPIMIPGFSILKAFFLLLHSRIFFPPLLLWLRAGETWRDERYGLLVKHTTCLPFLCPTSFLRSPCLFCRKEKSDWRWQMFLVYLVVDTGWLPQVVLCCQVPLIFLGPGAWVWMEAQTSYV